MFRRTAPKPADEVPLYGGGVARRRSRIRLIKIATAVTVVLLLIGGGGWLLTQRNKVTSVSLDDAVADFRTDVAAKAAQPSADPGSAEPAARPKVADAAPTAKVQSASVPQAEAAAPSAAPAGPYSRPAAGVYTYVATGSEKISIFGAAHAYPAEYYATVRHLDGCHWEHRNQVIKEHEDVRTLCSKPGSYAQVSQARYIEFFGSREGGLMTCDEPLVLHAVGEKPGTTSSADCTDGKGTDTYLTRYFRGIEPVTIGGRKIDALHVQIDGSMTGRTRGTSVDHMWLHPDTGMTLKWQRIVDTDADAAFGSVHYNEDATFTLKSLEPQR